MAVLDARPATSGSAGGKPDELGRLLATSVALQKVSSRMRASCRVSALRALQAASELVEPSNRVQLVRHEN